MSLAVLRTNLLSPDFVDDVVFMPLLIFCFPLNTISPFFFLFSFVSAFFFLKDLLQFGFVTKMLYLLLLITTTWYAFFRNFSYFFPL